MFSKLSRGVDAGTPWAFEPTDGHWRLHDLLTNKRAAGRPKDLADVQALEQRGR